MTAPFTPEQFAAYTPAVQEQLRAAGLAPASQPSVADQVQQITGYRPPAQAPLPGASPDVPLPRLADVPDQSANGPAFLPRDPFDAVVVLNAVHQKSSEKNGPFILVECTVESCDRVDVQQGERRALYFPYNPYPTIADQGKMRRLKEFFKQVNPAGDPDATLGQWITKTLQGQDIGVRVRLVQMNDGPKKDKVTKQIIPGEYWQKLVVIPV